MKVQMAPPTMTTDNSILNWGKDVLKQEATALLKAADVLNRTFIDAVTILSQTKGRIIVSGMGKSGQVGKKIAATLSSTGSPAFFVHPAEASHGDLGMVAKEDTLLLLSNSGETSELHAVLEYAKRFSIPIIAICGKEESTLVRCSKAALVLPDVGEACPHGLAPTTSTTVMMAIGDALAVSLLRLKGFSSADFKIFHPGGNLGQQLMLVRDKMHTAENIPLVHDVASMREAILEMSAKGFGCVGIINAKGNLLGVITDGDLRRHMADDLMQRSVLDVMTAAPRTIQSNLMMAEALAFMEQYSITSLFVVDADNTPEGIIHIHDFLRHGVA